MDFSIFKDICNHHYSQFYNIFITSKRNPVSSLIIPHSFIGPPPNPSCKQPLNKFQSLQTCLFQTFYINGSIYIFFLLQSFSLNIMFSRFVHVVIFHCMDIPQFVYLFISQWTYGLFAPFGCCDKQSCTCCCVDRCFHLS